MNIDHIEQFRTTVVWKAMFESLSQEKENIEEVLLEGEETSPDKRKNLKERRKWIISVITLPSTLEKKIRTTGEIENVEDELDGILNTSINL